MEWNEMYSSNKMPSFNKISEYINSSLWKNFCSFIETNYNVEAKIEYSSCSLLPGWNIKYKKSNKSICTIYPKADHFTCMVTTTGKNQEELEYFLPSCTKHVQEVYQNTSLFNGTKWLMFDITSAEILKDVKEIISIKMKK